MSADSPPIFPLNRSQHSLFKAPSALASLRIERRQMDGAARPPSPGPAVIPAHVNDPVSIKIDAESFLKRSGHVLLYPDGGPDGLRRAGLNVRKASDKQHLEAIAQAYAFHVQFCSHPNRTALVAELETLSGRKRGRTTTDLHLIVERFVSYGGDTPAERLAARKLVSRDVRAIQHLEAARVLPSRVQALGATTGEGLHAWARRAAVVQPVRRKTTMQTAAETRSEQRQRALVHKVTITTQWPDGTRKRRAKVTVTGVLTSQILDVRQRLTRIGANAGGLLR